MSSSSFLFPEELIEKCLSDDILEDPGEVLQLILTVLEDTTTTNNDQEGGSRCCSMETSLLRLLLSRILLLTSGGQQTQQQQAWTTTTREASLPELMYQCLINAEKTSLLSSIQDLLSSKTNNNNSSSSSNSSSTTTTTTTTTTSIETAWYLGIQLISILLLQQQEYNMTPFEVHSIAIQQSLTVGRTAVNNTGTGTTKDCHSSSSSLLVLLYWTLLNVLCTWSLTKCKKQIMTSQQQQLGEKGQNQIRGSEEAAMMKAQDLVEASSSSSSSITPSPSSPSPPKRKIIIRYKRIKSLLLETIQLYQRHYIGFITSSSSSSATTKVVVNFNVNIDIVVPLWLRVIQPIGQSLWEILPEDTVVVVRQTSSFFLWQAITIGMASQLMVLVVQQQQQQQQQSEKEEEEYAATTTTAAGVSAAIIQEEIYHRSMQQSSSNKTIVCFRDQQQEQQQSHGNATNNININNNNNNNNNNIPLSLEMVIGHPWRVAQSSIRNSHGHRRVVGGKKNNKKRSWHGSSQQQQHLDTLSWWTIERRHNTQHHCSDDEEEDDDSIVPDEYESIDTTWNELGIAIIAYRAWGVYSYVYQPEYQWKLWFPHVANLMNPDNFLLQDLQQQQHQNDEDDDDDPLLLNNNNNTKNQKAAATTIWMNQGLSLLKELLFTLPRQSLSLSRSYSIYENNNNNNSNNNNNNSSRQGDVTTTTTTSYNNRRKSSSGSSSHHHHHHHRPCDHPVGTFQLLLNGIVASSSSSSTQSSSSTSSSTTMELAQLCKDLLSKYTPTSQVEIIFDHLLPVCPHPGLKPKLLDLLRPLVATTLAPALSLLLQRGGEGGGGAAAASSSATTVVVASTTTTTTTPSNNNNNVLKNDDDDDHHQAGVRLKQEITRIIQDLGRYCERLPNHNNNEEEKEEDEIRLQNVDDLIDQVELFISACALAQLLGSSWWAQGEGDVIKLELGCSTATTTRSSSSSSSSKGNNKSISLKDFGKVLNTQLLRWANNNNNNNNNDGGGGENIPDQFFRLNLLDMSIQQLVNSFS